MQFNIADRFIKRKPREFLGLDIGSSSIKIIRLVREPSASVPRLDFYRLAPLTSNADPRKIIKSILSEAGISGMRVNTSISGQAVIVRYVQMPKMTREELRKALKLGIGKYIPFSPEDVNYDFQTLETADKSGKNMPVLMVAARKEVIEERISLLRDVGLIPNIIDVDSFAVLNSFNLLSRQETGTVAVLDVGSDITSSTMLRDGMPFFNRDISMGGNALNKVIRDVFDLPASEAEEFKQNPGDRYGELITAVKPVLDSLCREIQLSINYCEGQMQGPVQKIYLTGGTAKFKGVDKVLNSILGLDVEIWNPLQSLVVSEELKIEELAKVGPLFTVAAGLALRES